MGWLPFTRHFRGRRAKATHCTARATSSAKRPALSRKTPMLDDHWMPGGLPGNWDHRCKLGVKMRFFWPELVESDVVSGVPKIMIYLLSPPILIFDKPYFQFFGPWERTPESDQRRVPQFSWFHSSSSGPAGADSSWRHLQDQHLKGIPNKWEGSHVLVVHVPGKIPKILIKIYGLSQISGGPGGPKRWVFWMALFSWVTVVISPYKWICFTREFSGV